MAELSNPSVAQTALLLRYLGGQTTPAESEAVERWVAAHPDHARALAMLERAFEVKAPAMEPAPEPSSADEVWRRLAARLPQESPAPLATDVTETSQRPLALHRPAPEIAMPARRRRAEPWLRAAVVFLVAGAGFALWQTSAHRGSTDAANQSADRDYHEYVTRPSERALFTLPDGTQVTLGVASRLRVPVGYGRASREVTLDGEAYFDVRHDPARRFFVHTAHGVTEDLGTRFDVRDYAGDTAVRVVVAEGRVALQAGSKGKPVVLTRGELGHTTSDGAVAVRRGVNLDRYLAWLDGRLVLERTPLREALPELSRWYDIDFRLGDSTLAATRLTAVLSNQPITDALDLLAVTLAVRVEREGRTVTLYPQTAPRTP